MNTATILLIIMWLLAAIFFVILAKDIRTHKGEQEKSKIGYNSLVSAVANFLIH